MMLYLGNQASFNRRDSVSPAQLKLQWVRLLLASIRNSEIIGQDMML